MRFLPDKPLRRLLPLLKLATKIADKIPARDDTWPQKVAKVLSLFDAANEVYGGGRSKMRELTDRYSLVERESETFVRIFFATTLRDTFTIRRQQLGEHEDLIEAIGADGERIFFREYHGYGNARIESDFYITPGVDFSKVIDRLWAQYRDGIYLSITTEAGGWKKETTICDVPPVPEDRLSRAARVRLTATVDRHSYFAADSVHRAYLCFGPAGTGKSTFAVLIIDDLDRAPIAEVGARVLFLLERLKTHYPTMTVVLSVNDPAKLDAALLRCGRIDIPISFDAPERDEMEQMVRAMLAAHKVPAWRATGDAVKRILDASEGLTHAYLDDLCRRLRHEEIDDVIVSVNLLKSLAEKALSTAAAPVATAPGQTVGSAPRALN